MTVATDIINDGLDEIGVEHVSPSDGSKASILAFARWDRIRRACLRDHPWNCVSKRATLTVLAAAPTWGYEFQYQLPADCLRVLELLEEGDGYAWKIEAGPSGGGVLLTDSPSANIRYIKDETDPTQFDSLLVAAMSSRVAWELAFPLTQSLSTKQAMGQLYGSKMQAARSVDAQEGSADELEADAWVDARNGGTLSGFRRITPV